MPFIIFPYSTINMLNYHGFMLSQYCFGNVSVLCTGIIRYVTLKCHSGDVSSGNLLIVSVLCSFEDICRFTTALWHFSVSTVLAIMLKSELITLTYRPIQTFCNCNRVTHDTSKVVVQLRVVGIPFGNIQMHQLLDHLHVHT